MSHHKLRRTSSGGRCVFLVSEAEFHRRLIHFFGPYLRPGGPDWDCIRRSLILFVPYLRFRELLDIYFDVVFGFFEEFRATHAVVANCLAKYCRFKLHCFGFSEGERNDEFPFDADADYNDYLLGAARTVGQMPSKPYLYRDLGAVRRILRYAAPPSLQTDDLQTYTDQVIGRITRDLSLREIVFLQYVEMPGVSATRLKLTLMAIDCELLRRSRECPDAVHGFRLLFQAVPEPHVTWLEIHRFLRRIFMGVSGSASYNSCIRELLESCAHTFPECLGALGPRSLKHLARCEVRACLGRAGTLPHGVWELRLPRALRDYVLLQASEDQFRPVLRQLSDDMVFILKP